MRIKTMNSIFVLVTGVILLSGIFVSGVYSFDAFAEKGGNDKQQAKGCQNASNDKVNNKNKHCDITFGSLPSNTCDGSDNSTPDGALTAAEIPGINQSDIDGIEVAVSTSKDNGVIDTMDEWNLLQLLQPGGVCIL